MNQYKVTVLGAGLAGCEAALWLAGKGVQVELYEQKPAGNKSQKQQERDYGNRPRMPSGGHKAAQSRADASATIV